MPTDTQNTIEMKSFLLFIPGVYLTYLFHEFGHWSVGEIVGCRLQARSYIATRKLT